MSKKKQSNPIKKHVFTDEEIAALVELGEALRSVVRRLVTEGKAKIVDGKIIFLEKPKK